MSVMSVTSPYTHPVQDARSLSRQTGALMTLLFSTFIVCLVTLGATINWPAILDEPANVVLPLILQQWPAVLLGYSAYLASSLLLIPVALLLRRTLDPTGESALLSVATVFGVLSGVIKPLGILRWLVAMPGLARAYVDPSASDTTRQTISLIYMTLNDYAGTLGEVLGVALLGGLWALLVGVALLRLGRGPRWLAWFGVVAGALALVPLLEVGGIDLGPLVVPVNAAWYLWTLAFGLRLLRTH